MKVTGSLQIKNRMYQAVLSYYDENTQKWKQKWKTTKIKVEKGNKKIAGNVLKEIIKDFENELSEKSNSNIEVIKENSVRKNNYSRNDSTNLREQRIKANKDKTFIEFATESLEEFKNHIVITSYDSWRCDLNMMEKFFAVIETEEDKKKMAFPNVERRVYYKREPKLNEISQFDIDDLFSWLYDLGRKRNTVLKYYGFIKLIFDRAIRLEIIKAEDNPMNKVEKPKAEEYIADFYTPTEIKKLLKIVKGDVLEIPILIAAVYGLRRGEVLGLKWDAINFNNNTIIIRHTIQKVIGNGDNQIIMSRNLTKTREGYRTMPLNEEVKKALLRHKARIEMNKIIFKKSYIYKTNDYVCVKEDGSIIKPDHFTKRFAKIMKVSGLRKIRLHDLRHSVGSLLAQNNVNVRQIQDFLGHASIRSSNRYTHLEYQSKEISAGIIEQNIFKNKKSIC